MNKKNYLPWVKALEDLRDFAMNFKVRTEDGEGNMKKFQISGIRFCFLAYDRRESSWRNGFLLEKPDLVREQQLSVLLFYGNQKKEVFLPLVLLDSSRDPECIKTVIYPLLKSRIKELISEFYASSTSDNKYYQEDRNKPEYLHDDNFQIEEIPSALDSELAEKIVKINKDSYLAKSIIQVQSTFSFSRKLWIVLDSWGTRVIDYQDSYGFMHTCDLYDAKNKSQISQSFSKVFCNLAQIDEVLQEGYENVQDWIYSLGAKSLKSGIYPLIFSSAAVGTLFHEAVAAHMLSGFYIYTGVSTVFAKKIGKQIASEKFMSCLREIEIWDCPNDSTMSASYLYDMEGVRSQDVCLIDHGVVKNYLLHRNSAKALNMQNNGHALAGSFHDFSLDPVLCEPRISNLKILTDSHLSLEMLKEKLLSEFGYYLWVDSFAGEVNVETGTFELKVDRLLKIDRSGKKTWFTGGVLSSNLTDFLSSVHSVTNHYGSNQGVCGALSGWVPTEEYAPVMGVYGVNWIPDSFKQDDPITYDPQKEKYIPVSWDTKQSSFEI